MLKFFMCIVLCESLVAKNLIILYLGSVLFVFCHQLYDELEKTPFTLIETTEQLHELSQHLATVTEFAVDLEVHHITHYIY